LELLAHEERLSQGINPGLKLVNAFGVTTVDLKAFGVTTGDVKVFGVTTGDLKAFGVRQPI
jgi:hypothetical protein